MDNSILVIDDDLSVGKLISHYLPRNKILYYKSGEEALTYLKSSNGISHGFVDLMLPGQHFQGRELIEKIKQLNNKIKLFIITNHYTSYPPSTCIDCGADGYIAKPLKRHIIQAIVAGETEKIMNEMLKVIPDNTLNLNSIKKPIPIEKITKNDILYMDEAWCDKNYDTGIWKEARKEFDSFKNSGEWEMTNNEITKIEREDLWNGK